MKKVFKIISAYFLLIAAGMPLIFTVYFFVKKQVIRHEMKENLEQSTSHIVLVKANEVNWYEPGKEVVINGRMFDVDSYSLESGYYHFKGLFDDEETVLNKQIENNTRQTNQTGNRLLVQVFQILQSVLPENHNDGLVMIDSGRYEYCLIYPHIISQFKSVPTPPPQA